MTAQPDLEQQTGTTPADQARDHLTTIRKGWRHVLDPIETTTTSSTTRTTRPATEDEADEQTPPDARFDTPITLAFWVHAALDEWPTILQTLEPVDPSKPDSNLHLVTTKTIDCADVYAMVDLLHDEADRISEWTDAGHDFGATFVADLEKLARAVKRVAWPPKGDRMTIGDCPTCGRRVRVKAPTWRRVPQPTTDPDAYSPWSDWQPEHDKTITCRCGAEHTLQQWHLRIVDFEDREPKTAEELVAIIRERMGLRYQPLTVRTWARRGLITVADYSRTGHARYDVTQVLAALIDREKRRDREAS